MPIAEKSVLSSTPESFFFELGLSHSAIQPKSLTMLQLKAEVVQRRPAPKPVLLNNF